MLVVLWVGAVPFEKQSRWGGNEVRAAAGMEGGAEGRGFGGGAR